jgi:molecular chaperone DnaK (HSP70)
MRDAFIEQGAYRTLDVVIDRAWVAPVWAPIIERAVDCVARTLDQARWSCEQIDRVVLIGGSSSVPQFRDALAALVGADRITTTPQAGLAVAIGTTLVTAKLVQPSSPQPSLAGEDDGIPIHLA